MIESFSGDSFTRPGRHDHPRSHDHDLHATAAIPDATDYRRGNNRTWDDCASLGI